MKNLLIILLILIAGELRAQTTVISTFEIGTRIATNVGSTTWTNSSFCEPSHDGIISTDYAHTGTKSLRFQIDDTDPNCTGHMRSELSWGRSLVGNPYARFIGYNATIAWSELIPTSMAYDILHEVHFQMHDSGALGSPLWGIDVFKDRYYFGITIYDKVLNTVTAKRWDLGPVTKGVWVNFVVVQKLRMDPSGNYKVYKNGVLATGQPVDQVTNQPLKQSDGTNTPIVTMNINGTNLSRLPDGTRDGIPYPKCGIYKWEWTPPAKAHTVTSKVVYIDDIKIGDSTVPLSDFVPPIITIPPPTATVTGTNVTCYGFANGIATANVSGGTSPVTYAWSTGATTQTISSLSPGTYSVTATDAKGNKATASVKITQPAAALAMTTTYGVIYSGGSTTTNVIVTATGGTAPYTGTGTFVRAVGTFIFNVTDAKGCAVADTITIPLTPAPGFTIDLDSVDVLCYGASTGSATSNITGGTGPFTYSWSDGTTGASITSKKAGIYTLTATDALSVVASKDITINQPTQLVASNIADTVRVSGGTADVVISASGGTPSYSGTGTFSQVVGLKTYTVTDSNGCKAQTIANVYYIPTIPDPPPPVPRPGNGNLKRIKIIQQ